jgi:hypothetical protein
MSTGLVSLYSVRTKNKIGLSACLATNAPDFVAQTAKSIRVKPT